MHEEFISTALSVLEQKSLKRSLRSVDGAQGREIMLDGKKALNFCSNNYLGLADDPRLKDAAIRCIEIEGIGSGASRLVCGNMSAHRRLEQKLAEFKRSEGCLAFSTGYMANVGIISSLFGRGDLIFSDKLNHASIIDGIMLSGADFKRYPHRDMMVLEKMLKSTAGVKRKVIITDSVFSMDGDVAPLNEIVELAEKYGTMVMVDEAHALGVMGEGGRGAVEHFGLEGKIDIQMGTLSKAAGVFGAYCCGSKELISYLINRARSFVYTTGMPPMVAAAALRAVEIIEQDSGLRARLKANTDFLLNGLREIGFNTGESSTPIIPVIVSDSQVAVDFSGKLLEQGIFVQAIRPPTVPQNTARLRVTVMATHTKDDLNFLLTNMRKVAKELCLI